MKKLRKYLLVIKTNISNNMVYAADVFSGALFFALIVFVFMELWRAISANNGNMEGYTVNRLVWYYVAAETVMLSRCDVFRNMNREIKGGGIAYKLNKPYHFVLYQLAEGVGQISVRLLINSTVGIILGFLYVGGLEGFDLRSLPAAVLSVILGIFLNFFMDAVIGMSSFWTEDNSAFYWIAQKLSFMLGLFLPLEFLPGVIQKIALYLPFSYIAYAPARLLTSFSMKEFWSIVPVQVFYTALFAALSALIYSKGVKKLNVNGG